MKCFLFFLSLYASLLQANSLYEAEVDLNVSKDKTYALRQAFQSVINHLTPGPNDLDNPIINSANPESLLQPCSPTNPSGSKRLKVCFNPQSIHQLMNEAGQQPWIKNRPEILTFVFTIQGLDRMFITKRTRPKLFAAIDESAKQKGLTLNHSSEQHYELEAQFDRYRPLEPEIARAAKAAEKLKPEAILIIYLNENDKRYIWEQWAAYYNKEIDYTRDQKPNHIDTVGQFSMMGISAFLFRQGEEKAKTRQSVYVSIHEIRTAEAYRNVKTYIKQIPGVKKASVNSVTADSVLYTLDITIPTELLHKRLAQHYTPIPGNSDESIMNYRLNL